MTKKESRDAYQVVTQSIIEALEAGTVPWRRPWRASEAPRSLVSKRQYRGVNSIILALTAQAKGYDSPYWVTFNQAKKQGGSVRRGEKATPVILWKRYEREVENEAGEREKKPSLFTRFFYVFNTDQCDGLDVPEREEIREHDAVESAERIVAGYVGPEVLGPELTLGGDGAWYAPMLDRVNVPQPENFETSEAYYAVLFHELVHSTGHETRLKRDFDKGGFGTDGYGREELVAEIGACFVMTEADLEIRLDQSASYIAGWLKAIKDDPKVIVHAAAAAQKAADRIVGRTFEDETSEQTDKELVAA